MYESLLGYIEVLHAEHELDAREQQIASENVMGCLHLVCDELEGRFDLASQNLFAKIKKYETMNGRIHDPNDPELTKQREITAEAAVMYLRNGLCSKPSTTQQRNVQT